MTSRNYCFTSFVEEETTSLQIWEKTKYIIWGEETCPISKRLHHQGYIELKEPVRLAALKNIAATTHFEKRKGTQEEAIKYCMKENKFKEFGSKAKGQGTRTDLEELKESLDNKDSIKNISENHFSCFMKYNRSIKEYKTLHTEHRSWETNLEIHIGGPGSGKSHYCKTKYPNAYWMMKPNGNSVFFDGYDGQDTIILDEFYGWLPWDLLLRLADKYPLTLQTKGGSVNCVIKNLVITSNKPVPKWYNNITDIDPLIRRITLYKNDYITNKYIDQANFNEMKTKIMTTDKQLQERELVAYDIL